MNKKQTEKMEEQLNKTDDRSKLALSIRYTVEVNGNYVTNLLGANQSRTQGLANVPISILTLVFWFRICPYSDWCCFY